MGLFRRTRGGITFFLGESMAETVVRTLVIEDPEALRLWLAEEHPEGLRVDPEFLSTLALRGLIVDDEPDGDGERCNLIAPSGAIVPGVFIGAPELPEGEGFAEPENNHG